MQDEIILGSQATVYLSHIQLKVVDYHLVKHNGPW